ncbi:MAG: TIGR04211 family SH3 domain-containing protein [Deltaproteobacteria bacterium]|nr:TIGR04211 family SH3 domain-containing protein [Deltaproteobacteria bacterium]
MRRLCLTVLMVFGLVLMSQLCWAEKAYVRNKSKINLRKGPGVERGIVTMLEEDEPVEILGEKSGWSHVRLLGPDKKNVEGWVVTRYLVDRVPWKVQAIALKAENKRLKERLTSLEEKYKTTSDQRDALSQSLSANDAALQELQRKYESLVEGSSEFLQLKEAYDKMASDLQTAQTSAEKLNKENRMLKSSERNRWFLSGGAVLLLGLIIGLVMGRQQKRRKSTYY